MFIPDPDFYPSRISDPGSKTSQKREEKGEKKCCPIFFVVTNISKLKLIFEVVKRKI
jgi:hypothetical protein